MTSPRKNRPAPARRAGAAPFTATQNPAIDSVVPNASAGSVITAPAAMNTRAVAANGATVHSAWSRPPRSAACQWTSAPQPISISNDGSRAASALLPNAAIAPADSHVDSGGLPQNGTP